MNKDFRVFEAKAKSAAELTDNNDQEGEENDAYYTMQEKADVQQLLRNRHNKRVRSMFAEQ